MKFVLLFGPQAVGKMTVGHELAKMTDLKLFHNHMTIDLVHHFFDYDTKEGSRLVHSFREQIFEEVAKSNQSGMIFTYVWAFNEQEDWDYVDRVCRIFENQGADIYFVELEADLDERLQRNKSEFRLAQKPTKRDLEWSDGELISSMDKYRLNSHEGEIKRKPYLRMNNTKLSAERTAIRIKDEFGL
ncbi:AAA family ATPase [Fictibacillus enclensis]|uniref:AAA family ATPase n=1 Tax=Fictibacillus enclensis TaxID=1017270 RepID=UPI0024BFB7DC|nr:AAA family ATPase [Fictibacillus enclensis]WHY71749.1 AAA family ATPase [Fictibacillus enclensis]